MAKRKLWPGTRAGRQTPTGILLKPVGPLLLAGKKKVIDKHTLPLKDGLNASLYANLFSHLSDNLFTKPSFLPSSFKVLWQAMWRKTSQSPDHDNPMFNQALASRNFGEGGLLIIGMKQV